MLKPFTPASDFVPEKIEASAWESLEPLYRALNERPLRAPADLERLLLDRSELDAATAEAASNLYINMTCHTDDPAVRTAYLRFVEEVEPKLKQASFDLDKKIVQSAAAGEVDSKRYGELLRHMRVGVEIFRPENIPLETRLTQLHTEYSQITGAMTVNFRGTERTIPQMTGFLEDTDRSTREEAWRGIAQRRYDDHARLNEIYDEMVQLRDRVGRQAGFDNFRDYVFRQKRRFDYTPAECHAFAEGVREAVVPAQRRLNRRRAELLGLERLRPWDLAVDVKGRAPLRPFSGGEDLVEKTSRLFHRMDPSLGAMFDALRGGDCLDLESRKGKAPGGYQAMRDRRRLPFIFMNAAGLQRDVETMVHEAGHAFHSLLTRDEPLLFYRSESPMEFAEVASMSMELTAHPFLEEYYNPEDAARARRNHLESLATMLPWIAVIDQFQHWVYTHPGHTRDERTGAWLDLMEAFGPAVDWTGLEKYRDTQWQRQLHLFGVPFYYIEYGIAQLGALQLWIRYREDPRGAIEGYKRALSLGASRPLPALFEAAGLKFDMSPAMIARLFGEVERELERLPA